MTEVPRPAALATYSTVYLGTDMFLKPISRLLSGCLHRRAWAHFTVTELWQGKGSSPDLPQNHVVPSMSSCAAFPLRIPVPLLRVAATGREVTKLRRTFVHFGSRSDAGASSGKGHGLREVLET